MNNNDDDNDNSSDGGIFPPPSFLKFFNVSFTFLLERCTDQHPNVETHHLCFLKEKDILLTEPLTYPERSF